MTPVGRNLPEEHKLLAIFGKIPLFSDLSERYRKLILTLSRKVNAPKGTLVCKEGTLSDTMYILLSGKLSVRIKGSGTIATINPISTIGEMGVFTDERRSASVIALIDSALFVIKSSELNKLMESEPRLGSKLMRKVIRIMADRIQEHNTKIREYQNYMMSLEKEKS